MTSITGVVATSLSASKKLMGDPSFLLLAYHLQDLMIFRRSLSNWGISCDQTTILSWNLASIRASIFLFSGVQEDPHVPIKPQRACEAKIRRENLSFMSITSDAIPGP